LDVMARKCTNLKTFSVMELPLKADDLEKTIFWYVNIHLCGL
jgi:hypothetical protein